MEMFLSGRATWRRGFASFCRIAAAIAAAFMFAAKSDGPRHAAQQRRSFRPNQKAPFPDWRNGLCRDRLESFIL